MLDHDDVLRGEDAVVLGPVDELLEELSLAATVLCLPGPLQPGQGVQQGVQEVSLAAPCQDGNKYGLARSHSLG